MAISYLGKATQDVFTVGANQQAIVDGRDGIDTIYITRNQTVHSVNATQDTTQGIVFDAGVTLQSVTVETIPGTEIVTSRYVTINDGVNVEVSADTTFQIGGTSYADINELKAFVDANPDYVVTGNEDATPAPEFTVTSDVAAVDEGSAVAFSISNAEADKDYAYSIDGDVSAADIAEAKMGTFTTDANGEATVTVNATADTTTESAEDMIFNVVGESASATVTVNDTSQTPAPEPSPAFDLTFDAVTEIPYTTATNVATNVVVGENDGASVAGSNLVIDTGSTGVINFDAAVVSRNADFLSIDGKVVAETDSADIEDYAADDITFTSAATAADVKALIEAAQLDSADAGTDDDVTFTLTKDGVTTAEQTVEVNVSTDADLAISDLDNDDSLVTFDAAPTAIDTDTAAAINTAAAAVDVDGATMTVEIVSGIDTGKDSLLLESNNIKVVGGYIFEGESNGTISDNNTDVYIGMVTGHNEQTGQMQITLNANASEASINNLLGATKFDADDTDGADGERSIKVTYENQGISTSSTASVFVSSTVTPLTADTDTLDTSPSGNAVDVFGASTDTAAFLQSADSINAGDGTDFLFATLDGSDVAATLTNVNNITINDVLTSAVTFDAANVTGADKITVTDAHANLTIDNLTDSGISTIYAADVTGPGALTVNSDSATTMTVTGTKNADAFTMSDGSGTVTLNGGAGADTFAMNATLTSGDTIDGGLAADDLTAALVNNATIAASITAVETITLDPVAATATTSTFDMANASGTTTIAFANTGNAGDVITLDNVKQETTTVNGTGLLGDLNVNFAALSDTNVDAAVTVTAGLGANVIDLKDTLTGTAAQTADANNGVVGVAAVNGDTITGHATGTENVIADITHDITFGTANNAGQVKLTNVDTLTLTVALENEGNEAYAQAQIDADNTNVSTENVTAAQTDDKTLSITGNLVDSGVTDIVLDGGAAGEIVETATVQAITDDSENMTVDAAALGSSLVFAASLVDGASNSTAATLDITGTANTDDVLDLSVDNSSVGAGTKLVSTGVETINVTATDSSAALDVAEVADGTIYVQAGNVTSITDTNVNVDASANTFATTVNVEAANTAGVQITAGKGDDTLTGADGDDTFIMGANLTDADTIDGGAGTGDSLTATIAGLTATTGALAITNVENIHLTTETSASTLDLSGLSVATGQAEGVNVKIDGDQNTTITNFNDDIHGVDFSDIGAGVNMSIDAADLTSFDGEDVAGVQQGVRIDLADNVSRDFVKLVGDADANLTDNKVAQDMSFKIIVDNFGDGGAQGAAGLLADRLDFSGLVAEDGLDTTGNTGIALSSTNWDTYIKTTVGDVDGDGINDTTLSFDLGVEGSGGDVTGTMTLLGTTAVSEDHFLFA